MYVKYYKVSEMFYVAKVEKLRNTNKVYLFNHSL